MMSAMRIAQVAPLFESVPPKMYGGTERVVSYLTEELVRQGHEVTLFASGDSLTNARLVPACEQSLRLDPDCRDQLAHHIHMLEQVVQERESFDIIHYHIDYLHYPLSRRERLPTLTTLHGRLDLPDLVPLYRVFADIPVVSISNSQREPLPWINWQATVYHGLPEDRLTFYPEPGQYLAFLGRTSPEKGLDEAIRIAGRAGVKLKVAAKVDPVDQEYFNSTIQPLLDDPNVEFVGEIGYPEKNHFLGNALALLFPIQWPEPFGLVMIEAMACGTPVIAYSCGSAPEIVEDGVTGFLVQGEEQAVQAVARALSLDRERCHKSFEQRFSARRMCEGYLQVYERLVGTKPKTFSLPDGAATWMRPA
jgi:glycosyltransferase involved in cell wall biosynthesis